MSHFLLFVCHLFSSVVYPLSSSLHLYLNHIHLLSLSSSFVPKTFRKSLSPLSTVIVLHFLPTLSLLNIRSLFLPLSPPPVMTVSLSPPTSSSLPTTWIYSSCRNSRERHEGWNCAETAQEIEIKRSLRSFFMIQSHPGSTLEQVVLVQSVLENPLGWDRLWQAQTAGPMHAASPSAGGTHSIPTDRLRHWAKPIETGKLRCKLRVEQQKQKKNRGRRATHDTEGVPVSWARWCVRSSAVTWESQNELLLPVSVLERERWLFDFEWTVDERRQGKTVKQRQRKRHERE